MPINPNLTLAEAWAEDKVRLETLKNSLEALRDSQAEEYDMYIDTRALNAARNAISDINMRLENIDNTIAYLEDKIPS